MTAKVTSSASDSLGAIPTAGRQGGVHRASKARRWVCNADPGRPPSSSHLAAWGQEAPTPWNRSSRELVVQDRAEGGGIGVGSRRWPRAFRLGPEVDPRHDRLLVGEAEVVAHLGGLAVPAGPPHAAVAQRMRGQAEVLGRGRGRGHLLPSGAPSGSAWGWRPPPRSAAPATACRGSAPAPPRARWARERRAPWRTPRRGAPGPGPGPPRTARGAAGRDPVRPSPPAAGRPGPRPRAPARPAARSTGES